MLDLAEPTGCDADMAGTTEGAWVNTGRTQGTTRGAHATTVGIEMGLGTQLLVLDVLGVLWIKPWGQPYLFYCSCLKINKLWSK